MTGIGEPSFGRYDAARTIGSSIHDDCHARCVQEEDLLSVAQVIWAATKAMAGESVRWWGRVFLGSLIE